MSANTAANKRRMFETLLERYQGVYLHLDPRSDTVDLPAHLKTEPAQVLLYGYKLYPPITQFVIDDDGVSAILSFQGTPAYTYVPWERVFMISTPDGKTTLAYDEAALSLAAMTSHPHLSAVSDDAEPAGDEAEAPVHSGPPKLRLVS